MAVIVVSVDGQRALAGSAAGALDPISALVDQFQVSLWAEVVAMLWAASWVAQSPIQAVTFYVDNLAVVRSAPGLPKCPALNGFDCALRALFHCMFIGRSADIRHVRSHEDDPVNELVDSLAGLASLREIHPPWCLSLDLLGLFLVRCAVGVARNCEDHRSGHRISETVPSGSAWQFYSVF